MAQAISVPSGDQAGCTFWASPEINVDVRLPSGAATMMVALPRLTLENAISPGRRGTGEMTGEAALGEAMGDGDADPWPAAGGLGFLFTPVR